MSAREFKRLSPLALLLAIALALTSEAATTTTAFVPLSVKRFEGATCKGTMTSTTFSSEIFLATSADRSREHFIYQQHRLLGNCFRKINDERGKNSLLRSSKTSIPGRTVEQEDQQQQKDMTEKNAKKQPKPASNELSVKNKNKGPVLQQRTETRKQPPTRTKNKENANDRKSHNSARSSNPAVALPDLETQLCYVRNGHAVLRRQLNPTLLETIKHDLQELAKKQEVLAWKQKVEVACNYDPAVSARCHTIPDCQAELHRRGIFDAIPFLQFFNTWRHLPSVYALITSPALSQTASVLLDSSSVRLYQDALFWKRPGDGPTPWHADAKMAPFDTNDMVTLWIPLHNIDTTGLIFASKTHNDFSLAYWYSRNDDDDGNTHHNPWQKLEDRYDHVVDYMPLQLGDVTAHSGWTLHCADGGYEFGGNDNNGHRLALAATFVDSRAQVRDKLSLRSTAGDNEDAWSYRAWIDDVQEQQEKQQQQRNTKKKVWNHPLVPIVWPPHQMTKAKLYKKEQL